MSGTPTKRDQNRGIHGGVVESYLNPVLKRGSQSRAPDELITVIAEGFATAELVKLQTTLRLTLVEATRLVGISKATFLRRQAEGKKLDPDTSDKIVRFARLLHTAISVLGSESNAVAWLTHPQYGLSEEVPIHYAQTEVGAREVEDLLMRIAHGVFS